MKFFVVENGLRTAAGHHLNNSLGLRRALLRYGISTRFLINRKANAELARQLDADACISFTPYDQASNDLMCGEIESLYIQAGTIAEEISGSIGFELERGGVIFVPTATQSEILALAWALQRISPDRRPSIVLNFTRENFLGPGSTRVGSVAGLYRFAVKALRSCTQPQRILLTSNGALMASMLSEVLLAEVRVLPIPKAYPSELVAAIGKRKANRKRVAVLGDMNEYKGFGLIPQLVDALPELDWLLQTPKDGSARHWGERNDALVQHANVKLVPAGVSPEEYYALFGEIDIVLTPYDKSLRRLQTSGVFAEAVAAGKVIVAPTSPWVMEHRLRGAWCGEVFEKADAKGIAFALTEVSRNFDALAMEAKLKASVWREEQSVNAYVSKVLDWLGVLRTGVVH